MKQTSKQLDTTTAEITSTKKEDLRMRNCMELASVGLSLNAQNDCRCKFAVLAMENRLSQGKVIVHLIEKQSGIILKGIEITRKEDEYEGGVFVNVAFASYSDFASVSPLVSEPGTSSKNFVRIPGHVNNDSGGM